MAEKSPAHRRPISRYPYALRFLGVLGTAYILSQFLRASNAVLAPELADDLLLSPQDLGFLTAAFFLVFALAQLPVGVALDRLGPRCVISFLLIFAGAGCFIFAGADTLTGLAAGRAFMGLGCASTLMGAFVVYSRWYPGSRFASFAGWQIGIGNLGLVAATFPLAAAVAQLGWRLPVAGAGVLALVLAGAVFLIVRDRPDGSPRPAPEPPVRALLRIGELFRDMRIVRLFPLNLLGYGAVASLSTLWAGPYLRDVHGLSDVERGGVLLTMAVGSIAGALTFGQLDRVFNSRKWVVAGGCSLSCTVFFILFSWDGITASGAAVLFAALTFLAGYMAVLMAHARALFPADLTGRGMTFANMLNMGGVAGLQVITGFIVSSLDGTARGAAGPYQAAFLVIGLLLLAALLVYLTGGDIRPGDEVHTSPKADF